MWDLKWLIDIKNEGVAISHDYFGKIRAVLPNSNVSLHRLRGNFASAIKEYCIENSLPDLTSILLGHSMDLATETYTKGISVKAKAKVLKGLINFLLFSKNTLKDINIKEFWKNHQEGALVGENFT